MKRLPARIIVNGQPYDLASKVIQAGSVTLSVQTTMDLGESMEAVIASAARRVKTKIPISASLVLGTEFKYDPHGNTLTVPSKGALKPQQTADQVLKLFGLYLWNKLDAPVQADYDKIIEKDPMAHSASSYQDFADSFKRLVNGRLTGGRKAFMQVHILHDNRPKTHATELGRRYSPTRFTPPGTPPDYNYGP